jgi:hypothetical protein
MDYLIVPNGQVVVGDLVLTYGDLLVMIILAYLVARGLRLMMSVS